MTRRLWLLAAVAVLIAPALLWTDFLRQHPLARPAAPTEYNQPQIAKYWSFLADARRFVPDGSSYTIKAPTPNDETQLFFLSQGLFVKVEAKPATYVWAPTGQGGDAKFVLVYGSAECPANCVSMREVKGGAVCSR